LERLFRLNHRHTDIGSRKQLFIDERWFAAKRGIRLSVNPPHKQLVEWPEAGADEAHGVHAYLNVIHTDGRYRMWYDSRPAGMPGKALMMRYAESDDGITWRKPTLDLFDIRGVETNNVVMPGAYGSVMLDPNGPDEHRYKAVCDIFPNNNWSEAVDTVHGGKQPDGTMSYFMALYLLTSPDGLRWKRARPFASPFFHDSQNQLIFDRRLDRYVAYLRWLAPNRPRCVARTEFDDPMQLPWPFRRNPKAAEGPQGTLERIGDEFDTVLLTEPGTIDPIETDIYCPCVVQYPFADPAYYFSFMPLYRHYMEGDTQDTMAAGINARGVPNNDGPIDVRLAVSDDGIHWQRPDYRPYLGLGLDWDRGSVYMAPSIIRHGNELRQYFVGFPVTHGFSNGGRVGLATQRLDGFVSADADYGGGAFTTPHVCFEGDTLTLNVDCSAMGAVAVELRDENNQPIPGFTLNESRPIDLNHLAAEVAWTGGSNVGSLAGRPISLHVQMRDCKLYAFQFHNSSKGTA
jgi:hypothetical protein